MIDNPFRELFFRHVRWIERRAVRHGDIAVERPVVIQRVPGPEMKIEHLEQQRIPGRCNPGAPFGIHLTALAQINLRHQIADLVQLVDDGALLIREEGRICIHIHHRKLGAHRLQSGVFVALGDLLHSFIRRRLRGGRLLTRTGGGERQQRNGERRQEKSVMHGTSSNLGGATQRRTHSLTQSSLEGRRHQSPPYSRLAARLGLEYCFGAVIIGRLYDSA